jgi:class 3 adenylate cyclase/tetratricopeptide (TPR) repeat protein
MFLDVSGFSLMTDALMGQGREGAEVLAVTMRAVFDPLVEAILAQGGAIIGYAGDSISALFPADSDETLAARHAMASAHAIQQARAAKPTFDSPYGAFRISVKIGLAIGSVSWGILHSRKQDRAVYYFRGSAVEEAARAEKQAGAGDIVVTTTLRDQLLDSIESKPRASFHALTRVSGDLPGARPISLPEVDPVVGALFVPPEIITQDLLGEFRQTVGVFLRIPDLTDDQLQHFTHTLFDLQAHYGGLNERIDFGDKGSNMVIVWGAPVAHENDIDRALNFLLDLRARVDFPLTAGVTYYTSYAGYIGGRLYETYATYGWGISMAARLMMAAPENGLWVDDRVFHRAGKRFQFEFVGEHTFKGFAQKQKVHALHGRKSEAEELFHGTMAGREAELQALTDFVAPIWEGRYAGVVGIWGEAGMGKSRLVYEFRRSSGFEDKDCLWALCRADEILRRSLNPFRYWLFQYFEVHAAQNRATRLQNFMDKLDELSDVANRAALTADLKRARPFLAALVDLEWPDSLYEQLDAQARYDNTIIALTSLIKAESLRQPLILFVEDAHYLDEDSKAFLPRLRRSLVADPVTYPIAILMTTRWQGTKVLLEDGLLDQDVDLSPLTDESIRSISMDLLGKAASAPLVRLVNERVEGNPFFAEQVLRHLQEQDVLELSASDEWMIRAAGKSSALPADIRGLLVARLDQLSGGVKLVVEGASILGRMFEVPVLRRMLADADSLEADIAAAERAAIWSPLGETSFVFNHELLRDVAYNMQLRSRRQELHARAFRALQDMFGDQRHRHNGALAHHSELAGLTAEACRYLALAGDAARDGYHNAQALDFYGRALAILPASEADESYRLHRERLKILAEHGTIEERTLEVEALAEVADTIGESGNVAEVILLRSRLASSLDDGDKSAQLAQQAKAMALEAGRYDVAIEAQTSLLVAHYRRGMYKEAVEHGEAGISLAREHKASQQEAFLLNWLGLAFLEMKNPTAARAYFEQSLDMFRAGDNVRGVARVLTNLGSVAGYQGNYTAALDYYEQSMRLAREIGTRIGECRLLANLGWISGLLGDYRNAQAYAERNLQLAREIGDSYTQTISLTNLSSHAGAMGEIAVAIDYAERGLALARQSNDRNLEAWALTYLGHGLLESGLATRALESYQEALELRHELDQKTLATEPAAGIARIYLQQGESAAARRHADQILAQLEQDGTLEGTDQPLRVYLNCYLVLSGTEDSRAMRILNTAHDMLKTRANGISDPSARKLFLENITYNKEILTLWEKHHQSQ